MARSLLRARRLRPADPRDRVVDLVECVQRRCSQSGSLFRLVCRAFFGLGGGAFCVAFCVFFFSFCGFLKSWSSSFPFFFEGVCPLRRGPPRAGGDGRAPPLT